MSYVLKNRVAPIKITNLAAINRGIMANAHTLNGVPHAEIPCELLILDAPYQRGASGYASKIASEWSNYKAGDIIVSYRDNQFYVVDGANRVRAAMLHGQDTINCIIYENKTEEEEAMMFANQNENRKVISSVDKLNARIVAGDPAALNMKKACDEFGVKFGTIHQSGYVTGIAAMCRIYETNGYDGLKWVLNVIEDANWHNQPKAYGSVVMRVVGNIYDKYGNKKNMRTKLLDLMKTTTPRRMMAEASISYPAMGDSLATMEYIESKLGYRH